MESLPKGWQAVRYDLYANDSTGGRVGAKHPCQCELQKHQFAEGRRRSQCNRFTLYSTDSSVTKNNFPRIRELMHENGSGKCMGCVEGYRWCMSHHMYYGFGCINHRVSSLQS